MEHQFHDFFPESLAEHLKDETYGEMRELGTIHQAMNELEHRANRRIRRVYKHMQHCGTCLSEQIKADILIELSDYWEMQQEMGGGRHPKLHYQVN